MRHASLLNISADLCCSEESCPCWSQVCHYTWCKKCGDVGLVWQFLFIRGRHWQEQGCCLCSKAARAEQCCSYLRSDGGTYDGAPVQVPGLSLVLTVKIHCFPLANFLLLTADLICSLPHTHFRFHTLRVVLIWLSNLQLIFMAGCCFHWYRFRQGLWIWWLLSQPPASYFLYQIWSLWPFR